MTEKEYRELQELNLLGIIALFTMVFTLCTCLAGCKQVRYIPVESVRVDSVVVRDTTMQVVLVPYKDSIVTKDTASCLSNPYAYSHAMWSGGMLHHSLGIFPQTTATVKVPYFIDRYVRIREPQVVEVERKLTRIQRLCMDTGKVVLFGVIPFAMIIVGWLVFKKLKR